MEEETCQINLITTPERISEVFHHYFGEKNGINLDLPDYHEPHNPIAFKA